MTDITDIAKAKIQFSRHRCGAISRGVGFELTFEQWCEIWEKSGKYLQRGTRVGQYGMQRYWDNGPYRVGNVEIGTPAENQRTRSNRCQYRKIKPRSPSRRGRLAFIERNSDCSSPEEILIEEEAEFS